MTKNQKGFSVVEVLIVLVIVGILGAGGWFVHSRQTKPVSKTPTPSFQSKQTAVNLMPEDVTEEIKSTYAAKYKLLNIDQNNHPKAGEMSVRLEKRSPAYKAEGYNFYNSYDGGSTLDLILPQASTSSSYDFSVNKPLRTEIAGIYTKLGLAKKETRGDGTNGMGTDVYLGRGLICTIEMPGLQSSSNTASCGKVDAYAGAAAELSPIAKAYPNTSDTTVFVGLKITDSKVTGYQRAEVGTGDMNDIGGSVALFYKKDSGDWMYFHNAQTALACSSYNTQDLKNAFQGEACYDASNQTSTVQ